MEEKERMMYEAAAEGNVSSLLRLLGEDQLLLHRISSGCFTKTPLHVAAMLGHLEFAEHILARLPQMAAERDTIRNLSPLHLASQNGHLQLVKQLLLANPQMCLVKDCQGRTPLHVAVIKGHTEILKELVLANPPAVRVHAGTETILHLCVRHQRLEALKYLVGILMAGDAEFINSKDHNGSTILHLAAESRQDEMFEFLRNNTAIDVDCRNTAGFLALDIEQQVKIFPEKGIKEFRDRNHEEYDHHRPAGGRSHDEGQPLYSTAAERWRWSSSSSKWNVQTPNNNNNNSSSNNNKDQSSSAIAKEMKENWVERKKQSLMVVAGLIATVTYQAGFTPPCGIWGDSKDPNNASSPSPSPSPSSSLPLPPSPSLSPGPSHQAGVSILADYESEIFEIFLALNSTSFISSLTIILLLVSGLPLRRRMFMWILMVIIWLAITTMAWTYMISIDIIRPPGDWEVSGELLLDLFYFWIALTGILFYKSTIRLIILMVRKMRAIPFGSFHQYVFRFSPLYVI